MVKLTPTRIESRSTSTNANDYADVTELWQLAHGHDGSCRETSRPFHPCMKYLLNMANFLILGSCTGETRQQANRRRGIKRSRKGIRRAVGGLEQN